MILPDFKVCPLCGEELLKTGYRSFLIDQAYRSVFGCAQEGYTPWYKFARSQSHFEVFSSDHGVKVVISPYWLSFFRGTMRVWFSLHDSIDLPPIPIGPIDEMRKQLQALLAFR